MTLVRGSGALRPVSPAGQLQRRCRNLRDGPKATFIWWIAYADGVAN